MGFVAYAVTRSRSAWKRIKSALLKTVEVTSGVLVTVGHMLVNIFQYVSVIGFGLVGAYAGYALYLANPPLAIGVGLGLVVLAAYQLSQDAPLVTFQTS